MLFAFSATLSWSPLSTRVGAISRARCGTRCATPALAADWALLFDCDGVLADTERDGHRVGFNQVFGEDKLGFEWGVEEYGRLCEVGGGKERMTAYMNTKGSWPEVHKTPSSEQLEKGLPVDQGRLQLVTGLHKRKTAVFQDLIKAGTVPLRPGILRIVDEAIAADVPVAVCSTYPPTQAPPHPPTLPPPTPRPAYPPARLLPDHLLPARQVCSTSQEASVRTLVQTLMGDARYAKFEFFCGDVVPRKKPNPDVYNLASETMGYPAARRAAAATAAAAVEAVVVAVVVVVTSSSG